MMHPSTPLRGHKLGKPEEKFGRRTISESCVCVPVALNDSKLPCLRCSTRGLFMAEHLRICACMNQADKCSDYSYRRSRSVSVAADYLLQFHALMLLRWQ